MKKYLYLLIFLAIPALFTSCGDDKDKNEEPEGQNASIVGKWYAEGGYKETDILELNANGTFTFTANLIDEICKSTGAYIYDEKINTLTFYTSWTNDPDGPILSEAYVGNKIMRMKFKNSPEVYEFFKM